MCVYIVCVQCVYTVCSNNIRIHVTCLSRPSSPAPHLSPRISLPLLLISVPGGNQSWASGDRSNQGERVRQRNIFISRIREIRHWVQCVARNMEIWKYEICPETDKYWYTVKAVWTLSHFHTFTLSHFSHFSHWGRHTVTHTVSSRWFSSHLNLFQILPCDPPRRLGRHELWQG